MSKHSLKGWIAARLDQIDLHLVYAGLMMSIVVVLCGRRWWMSVASCIGLVAILQAMLLQHAADLRKNKDQDTSRYVWSNEVFLAALATVTLAVAWLIHH